jgi:hypothetical protein
LKDKGVNVPPLAGGVASQPTAANQPAQQEQPGQQTQTSATTPPPTPEEIAEVAKDRGAKGTFDFFGGENAGGGGIFPMLLFMMVMMAMGKETDVEKSRTAEGREEQLRQADIDLGFSVPSTTPAQPGNNSDVALASTNSFSSLPIPPLSSSITSATNVPNGLPTPQSVNSALAPSSSLQLS